MIRTTSIVPVFAIGGGREGSNKPRENDDYKGVAGMRMPPLALCCIASARISQEIEASTFSADQPGVTANWQR